MFIKHLRIWREPTPQKHKNQMYQTKQKYQTCYPYINQE